MSAKTGKRDLLIGGEPRVQLLPPTIAERERGRRARSLAVLATILAIVVVGGATTLAFLQMTAAAQALEDARAQTAQIQTEQTQYAPGRAVADAVANSEAAISTVGSTEVLWSEVFADILAALPPGTVIDSAEVVSRAPWEPPQVPEAALRGPREVSIMLTLSSDNVLDPAVASRLFWATVPSLADLYIYETQGEGDKGRFLTKIELTLDSTVLSGRYAPDKLEELLEGENVKAVVADRKLSDDLVRALYESRAAAGPSTVTTPEDETEGEGDAEDASTDEATSEGSAQ